ncbi:unnamed protein product [Linum tenue]|uniref:Secreted protein n=1 Tax=Linum tenue TaxID=586396 RepID=A0AAV0Q7H5_9ROSI|nr:unnamed protein product [Linum tenue]
MAGTEGGQAAADFPSFTESICLFFYFFFFFLAAKLFFTATRLATGGGDTARLVGGKKINGVRVQPRSGFSGNAGRSFVS